MPKSKSQIQIIKQSIKRYVFPKSKVNTRTKPKKEIGTFRSKKSKPIKLVKKESDEAFNLRKARYYYPMREPFPPMSSPPGFHEAVSSYGAGGIGVDFPQGDIGQPFWFSNIGGNHFPREGFTYRPYDLPVVPFKEQMKGYIDDEDAQMGVNFLAAKTTGGRHYFKGKTKFLTEYVKTWTDKINLDYLNWQIAKELLAFGNSFWILRVPIWKAKSINDFLQVPIESSVRIWWTPDRRPLWYEFRGAEYNGYFRPTEILHFHFNRLNGQVYGFGIMAQLTNRVSYLEDTPDGAIFKERESYLDIKHGLQNVTYKVMKRYLPRLVIGAPKAGEDVRDAIRDEMRVLHDSEDIVHVIPGLDLKEIGNATRPIDPSVFMDLFQSSIFKAVQTSKGRIAGQSEGPSYANGEESAILDEIGMAQFPIQLKFQIQNMIVKPWYEFNRIIDENISPYVAVPWDVADFEMMFGKQTKKDLEPEQVAQWVQILQQAGQISNSEIRKIAEYVGVPELISDEEGGLAPDQPDVMGGPGGVPLTNPTMAMKKSPAGEEETPMQFGGNKPTRIPGSPNKSKFSRV